MHELVKNEKKESRARPLLQTRTGPTALSNSMSLSIEEKQQKRIAARAATAMAQVLHRRREPRSLLMWGDRKKAIIKNYPDGGQEIIVPQTLTPEQEHYEFPPRSRFLKKLATSTAERRRLSILQDHVVPCSPADLSSTPASATVPPSTTIIPNNNNNKEQQQEQEMKQPDQLALQEWFSKKDVTTLHNRNSKQQSKDRAVIDWMNDVERSSKSLLLLKHQPAVVVKPSPTPSSCCSNKIQFKSDAGKRWANSITSNTSLIPPDDTSRKHYVPRRLLLLSKQRATATNENNEIENVTDAASKIQKIWRDYQNNSRNNHPQPPAMVENQIGMAAMATTGQRTPIAGMVQLVQMLHNSLKVQQQRSHDRMEQLELLLQEETKKRQLAEETMKKLETVYQHQQQQQPPVEKEKTYQTLLFRVTELEQSVKREGQSRKELEVQLLQATNSNNATTTKRTMTRKPSVTIPISRKSSIMNPPTSRKSSVMNNATPVSSRKSSIMNSSSPSVSRKQSVMNTTTKPRSLARTSSLANAGVKTSSSVKRTTTKPPIVSSRRMTTVSSNNKK